MSGRNAGHESADVAQSVERRLGKAEVTGSIPVISLLRKIPGNRDLFVMEKEDASFAWGRESADCVQCGIDCGDAVDSHIVFRDTDGAEK